MRLSFARMWTLIQNNYSTYFGKYRSLFAPELLAAIFFEESKFENRPGVGNAAGFGQVQPATIDKVNHFWERQDGAPLTFQRDEILADDPQSVQIAGLTLAMQYEDRVERRHVSPAGDQGVLAALDDYAGGHSEEAAAVKNRITKFAWLACRDALKPLALDATKLANPSAQLVEGVRQALIQLDDERNRRDTTLFKFRSGLHIDSIWERERRILFPVVQP